jgi:hypothetical protein
MKVESDLSAVCVFLSRFILAGHHLQAGDVDISYDRENLPKDQPLLFRPKKSEQVSRLPAAGGTDIMNQP